MLVPNSRERTLRDNPCTENSEKLSIRKSFCSYYESPVLEIFWWPTRSYGRKAPWTKLVQDFNFSIRYRKGFMNTIADSLSRTHEVNILNFTEIKCDLYENLRGNYLDDSYFKNFSARAEFGTNDTNTASSKAAFHISNSLLTVMETFVSPIFLR